MHTEGLLNQIVTVQEYYKNTTDTIKQKLEEKMAIIDKYDGQLADYDTVSKLVEEMSEECFMIYASQVRDSVLPPVSLYLYVKYPGECPEHYREIDMFLTRIEPNDSALKINSTKIKDDIRSNIRYAENRWNRIIDFNVHEWSAEYEMVERHLENLKDRLPSMFNQLLYNKDVVDHDKALDSIYKTDE